MHPMRITHWIAALLGGVLVTLANIKRFGPWDQVTDLWDAGVSPLLLAITGHPHFFRYLTAYPGFLLEERFAEIGFSLYIAVFAAFNVTLWRRVSLLAAGQSPALMAWIVFLTAHFFMNGRGVIAWTGWLLCVSLCLRRSQDDTGGIRQLFLAALACWLAAVSTGVFIVVVVSFVVFHVQYRVRVRQHAMRRLLVIALAAPVLVYVADYLLLAVRKNVDFFGGGLDGVINMLAHGAGRVLFGSGLMAVLIVATAAFVLLFLVMMVKMRKRPFTPLEKLIAFAAAGGLFGITVLTLAVPLALLYRQVRPLLAPQAQAHNPRISL